MFVVVASQQAAAAAYVPEFIAHGFRSFELRAHDLETWLDQRPESDLGRIRGFLVDEPSEPSALAKVIRNRTPAPIIALNEQRSLDRTLALLTAGIDDVVSRPIHVKEILARSEAIWRRHRESHATTTFTDKRLKIFFDGRDPEIDGIPLLLPRRERDILEFLVRHSGRPVSKAKVFSAVYDPDQEVSDSVVEGHISKLRRKLRERLGYDPVLAKRYEGYTYIG